MPDTALPATTAPPHDPVRAALDDPAVSERLRAQARAVVRRPGIDPEDVLQNAAERALANAHKFNPELGSVTVWLAGFVRKVALEQLKRTAKGATSDGDLDRWPAPPTDEAELADLDPPFQVPEKKKRKVIFAEGEYTLITLFPSPDGKRVAAWCKRPGETEVYDPKQGKYVPRVPPIPERNTIVVFDDKGEVIGTVDPE